MDQKQFEVLALLGATLLGVQTAEHMLKLAMTFAFPKDAPISLETLQAEKAEIAKKRMLGPLVGELGRRVSVEPNFEQRLEAFIANRNQFVHHLSSLPNGDMHTDEGLAEVKNFATNLFQEATELTLVFTGAVRNWQHEQGIEVELPDPEFFRRVDEDYKARARDLLGPKLPS